MLMRASHLALLFNMVADVEVSLLPCFSTGRLGKDSGASSQESHREFLGSTKHCSTEEQICGHRVVIVMQFVNQELNFLGCCSLSLQN